METILKIKWKQGVRSLNPKPYAQEQFEPKLCLDFPNTHGNSVYATYFGVSGHRSGHLIKLAFTKTGGPKP